ncbi:threonine synthase [Natrialbaceae archaeon GCM10025810]|uniref:threonine synthase n=1 Tax=Halovalidus salilacus TaxID=3075124 RepID=UPI0036179040
METTDAFAGLECVACGAVADVEAATHRCPECGGHLDPRYDYDAVSLDRDELASRPFDSLWRYEEVLPFPREAAVTTNEGATPLIDCPTLADELGVERVLLKDDGRNPTGATADRGQTVAVTAANLHGASDVALPSTGNGGQSAAAYAGRAGLESHVFLPARSGFTNKAMVNVHGGDMNVVGGRYADAVRAFEEAMAEYDGDGGGENDDGEEWYSLAPFETPFRREGQKTLGYELVEQLEWTVPDAVVVPTGSGVELAGLYKAATELLELGLVDETPALYAAQAAGCAPITEAFEAGRDAHEPVEYPDTICGDIEVPDPAASTHVLEAIRETDGGAISTDDHEILESAVTVAQHEGLEVAPSPAAAVSGAWELAERGAFDGDETVVLLNTATGNKEADVLRSHLMGQGV